MQVLLVSQSPRRRQLLEAVGIVPVVRPVDIDETFVLGAAGDAEALRIATAKAHAGLLHFDQEGEALPRFGLTADTVVHLPDAPPLAKPGDAREAMVMLQLLRGRAHDVTTGFCVFDRDTNTIVHAEAVTTQVWFDDVSDARLAAYAASGEPLDKAGAYGIQGRAAPFVSRIVGCYPNVVGLPLFAVCAALRRFDASAP